MRLTTLFTAILIFGMAACTSNETDEPGLIEKARAIHDNVITMDTHADINTGNFTEEINYTQDLSTQVTLPKMEAGGLDAAFFIVYTGQDTLSPEGYADAYENADDKFKAIHRLTEEIAPDRIELAYNAADVRRIHSEGKLVALIGVENAYPVGTDLTRIEEFFNRGARYMSLAHNGHSQFSDSNTGEADGEWLHDGLSDLGREAIAEMNRLGIMVDISHPSTKANMETMQLSKAPVIASHSSARSISNVTRNLNDEELMMLKENGGVVQTVALRRYVNAEKAAARSEAQNAILEEVARAEEFEILSRDEARALPEDERNAYYDRWREIREMAQPRIEAELDDVAPGVDVADFVDHIDYMVGLIGIDHVGISSDFDGGGGIDGWNDASETFNVTLELVRRGYTEEEIRKIWGGNLLRVMEEVEKVAAELQAS
ncbi:membrane dipeptidase [Balneola sp. MJW-20]|uniref:membrane dipeptidase n=1 Tax=Gracilimonas aurantiaca TaxID=3234185 RepID=UPI003466CF96